MKIKNGYIIFLFLATIGCNQPIALLKDFDTNFKDHVFEHIVILSNFGIRQAEKESEQKTINYLKNQFEKYGLVVEVEPFFFDIFSLNKANVILGDKEIPYESMFFDPYSGEREYDGQAFFFNPDASYQDLKSKDLNQQIILTKSPANYYRLGLNNAKAIVYLNENDFDTRMNNPVDVTIRIDGLIKKTKSYNIVASLPSIIPSDSTIILSAHWDSIFGPGASDNASGVGVLLELAKYFTTIQDQLSYNIKFLSIGSEEIGLIGSQAYITTHAIELKTCKLLFNIDSVAGSKGIYIEQRGGINNTAQEKGNIEHFEPILLKARTDFDYSWNYLDPLIFQTLASCKPDWLPKVISKSMSGLNYKYNLANNMGSDHQVFALAGIPATNICITGNTTHSPEDNISQINKDSLEKTGKIVATIVLNTMRL